jgi:hypothetical protein
MSKLSELFAQDRYNQLAADAGLYDIGRRPYGPPAPLPLPESDYRDFMDATHAIGSLANPERFMDAMAQRPMSRNIENRVPAAAPFKGRSRGF